MNDEPNRQRLSRADWVIPLIGILLIPLAASDYRFIIGYMLVAPFIILGVLFVNGLIGTFVLACIDDDEQRLFKWFQSAPSKAVQFLGVQLWPVLLYEHFA